MTTFTNMIQALCTKERLPQELTNGFLAFCRCYEEATTTPANTATFTAFVEAVGSQLKTPYEFQPFHKGLDTYYQLGLDFIRPLVDFSKSRVDDKESLTAIQEAISRNENVILLANHQTEIDPQIISLLLEKEYPQLAQEMIFVAGHRVTTDPLAVPLSLGRNLICIYSKRHVDNPPEQKAAKLTHNQKALKGLEELLSTGGKCIYIAPSGGRDRVDASGKIQVAPFDPQAVEMFYLISQRAKRPTHFHSLALSTYDLLPPPDSILAEIGEQRKTTYSPAYLAFSPKIAMDQVGGCDKIADKKEKRRIRTDAIWQQVVDNYSKF